MTSVATPVDTTIIGNQRFLCQKDNLCASATITASATKTASGTVTADDPVRVGNSLGTVGLSGAYTDTDDATFDVEIRSGSGTTRRTSQPVFTGSGSGTTMTSVSATSGVPAEQITVKLIDLGTADKYAAVDFYGYRLKSKIPRSGGNLITITNDRSGITYTASGNTTPEAMSQDDYRFIGPGYDFGGAYELDADGQLNPGTRRFSFGSDPRVYRQYRRFEDSKEIYIVDPPLARDVAELATVKTVTGTYSVTVAVSMTGTTWAAATDYDEGDIVISGGKVFQVTTAGTSGGSLPSFDSSALGATTTDNTVVWSFVAAVATETFASLTTFFDLLKALLSSQLVELLGPGETPPVVTEDKTPGGTAAEDIPFLTDSFHLGFRTDGSDNIEDVQDINLDASSATRNEQLTIECTNNNLLGAEIWSVLGSGGGSYGTATTGETFSSNGISFLIPVKNPVAPDGSTSSTTPAMSGEVYVSDSDFAANTGLTDTYPQACVREYALGANAKELTVTFTYELRPSTDCECENATITNHINPACVGADTAVILGNAGEVTVVDAVNQYVTTQYHNITQWHAAVMAELAFIYDIDDTSDPDDYLRSLSISAYSRNIELFTLIKQYFITALDQVGALRTAASIDDSQLASMLSDWTTLRNSLDTDVGLALIKNPTIDDGDTGVSTDFDDQLSSAVSTGRIESYVKSKWGSQLAEVFTGEGFKSPFDDPNVLADLTTGECWEDLGGTHWWTAKGSDGRRYQPMFTNEPYVLVKETHADDGTVHYESLNIATFLVAIGCSENLTVGDTIDVSILAEAGQNGISDNRFYQLGDQFIADIVARSPLQLQNGRTGDNEQTWVVFGTVSGAYADYTVNTESPAAYSDGGLGFTITPGSIDNAIGDQFVFSVLLNQFRWRKDGGSWSSDTDIDATVALSDGLSAVFTEGAGASFESGDLFSFTVEQPYSPGHSVLPTSEYWTPNSASGDITYDFGTDQTVDMIAIAWHLIPTGATVTAQLLDSVDSELYSATLTRNADVMFDSLSSAQTGVRKLKLSFSSASGFWLAWVWCGESVYLNSDADVLTIRPARLMLRGGATQPGRHIARGYTGIMEWRGTWETQGETGFLSEDDIAKLVAIFESLKSNNDQPFALVPNPDYDNGWLLRWAGDEFEPVDDFAFNLAERTQRVQTTAIEFGPVYQ